jgi:hypothetical protein
MPVNRLDHEFVEHVPDDLVDGMLYISIPYKTVIHKCCCGCGHEVVTPLNPTDWELTFNGENISLSPSIGNWSFPCQSHYWIRRSRVSWARRWSPEEIAGGRQRDRAIKYEGKPGPRPEAGHVDAPKGRFNRLRSWLRW